MWPISLPLPPQQQHQHQEQQQQQQQPQQPAVGQPAVFAVPGSGGMVLTFGERAVYALPPAESVQGSAWLPLHTQHLNAAPLQAAGPQLVPIAAGYAPAAPASFSRPASAAVDLSADVVALLALSQPVAVPAEDILSSMQQWHAGLAGAPAAPVEPVVRWTGGGERQWRSKRLQAKYAGGMGPSVSEDSSSDDEHAGCRKNAGLKRAQSSMDNSSCTPSPTFIQAPASWQGCLPLEQQQSTPPPRLLRCGRAGWNAGPRLVHAVCFCTEAKLQYRSSPGPTHLALPPSTFSLQDPAQPYRRGAATPGGRRSAAPDS